MKRSLEKFDEKQIDFICDKASVSKEELFDMDEDQIYDIYCILCDASEENSTPEIEEIVKAMFVVYMEDEEGYTEDSKVTCPVCGKYEFFDEGDYDVCPVCFWENDPIQYDDPDYEGGANEMSLNQARKSYKEGKAER